MLPTTIARNLSASQRGCLISHIDGPQPLTVLPGGIFRTKTILVDRGLLCVPQNGTTPKARLKELCLSDLGREVVCHVLGEYADFLVAAGCLETLSKRQLMENINRASHRRPQCAITTYPAAVTQTDTCAQTTLRARAGSLRLLSLLQHGS